MKIHSLVTLAGLALVSSPTLGIIKAIDQSIVIGPVTLHEGARFEICANTRFVPESILVEARFLRVRDGASVGTKAEMEPGTNGCFSVGFEQAGDEPIIARLDTLGGLDEVDLLTSAAVINGIFEVPLPKVLEEDGGVSTATTFGPLVIPEGKRVQVCAHKLEGENAFTAPATVNFYLAEESLEPALSTTVELEPDSGACTQVSAEQAGGRPVLVEVVTDPVEDGFSTPMPVIGAFIVNGIFFAPLPGDTRSLEPR